MEPQHILVLLTREDLLIVRVKRGGKFVLAIVGHAPIAALGQAVVEAWWLEFDEKVATLRRASDLVFLIIDANARIGCCESPSIGNFAAETEEFSGEAFHAMLLGQELVVPATFEAFAARTDAQQWTWLSPHGTTHRIDYVAISADVTQHVRAAAVMERVPLAVEAAIVAAAAQQSHALPAAAAVQH